MPMMPLCRPAVILTLLAAFVSSKSEAPPKSWPAERVRKFLGGAHVSPSSYFCSVLEVDVCTEHIRTLPDATFSNFLKEGVSGSVLTSIVLDRDHDALRELGVERALDRQLNRKLTAGISTMTRSMICRHKLLATWADMMDSVKIPPACKTQVRKSRARSVASEALESGPKTHTGDSFLGSALCQFPETTATTDVLPG